MKVKHVVLFFILFLIIFFRGNSVRAEDPTPSPSLTPTPTSAQNDSGAINDLQNKIKEYQGKIDELRGQEKTLTSQIGIMDNQVKLTEYKIEEAKERLTNLEKDIEVTKDRIAGLETEITKSTKALIGRINATYQVGRIDSWQVFLSSDSISNFLTRLTYLKVVQANDKKTIFAAQQSKVNYSNEQTILTDKKDEEEALKEELDNYTSQLNQEKEAKQKLLAETQGNEANYQRLISQARAQLAGFQRFVASQGGASILSGQTNCDDWGCYYNQRDNQWGNNSLNGTQYTLASDGCLVTSMAMVYTHLGKTGVTPQTINSNPSNFASYYPAYLNKTISAEGMTTSRIYANIDSELNAGRPVIIGIGAGPDHFVVFISGSNGDYKMHDPFVPNGHNISFTEHYSISSINSIEKISY
jgi:peptidoglycan hydrolase CwlO-like protein